MKLPLLLRLQATFAAASLIYLGVSAIRSQTTGEPLSAAAIGPSIAMFVAYAGCLSLPHIGRIRWYRIAMAVAIVFFGVGGVIGNVTRYMESGLVHYAGFGAWAVAVAINAYGTVLNIIAALGLFNHSPAEQR